MDEPRTHYQISLTARQAVGLFVGLLLSLGLAFFFGLMTGLSGREKASAGPVRTPAQAVPAAAAPEAMPPVETAVPIGSASRAPRRDEAAGGSVAAAEPTPPPTLQAFEDSSAEEAATLPPPHPATTVRPAVPAKARAPGGRIWVQVASLSSRRP